MSVHSATGFGVPGIDDFDRGRVTNPDQSEIQRQGLFDSLLYPAAGQALLSFFSFPIGQGVTTTIGAVVGTTKSGWDTNLQLPNQLPSGKAFQIQSLEMAFEPGLSAAANTFTLAVPSVFAAAAAASVLAALNDVYTFYMTGRLQLQVLDKFYIDESPLVQFPPLTGVTLDSAIASNSATVGETAAWAGRGAGRPYVINIPMTLQPAMNFAINVIYPAAVALPSGFNGRARCRLDGYFLRSTQ